VIRLLTLALTSAALLLAADPTGTWTGEQPGLDGATCNVNFKRKADAGTLTGTIGGDQFQQHIQNGVVVQGSADDKPQPFVAKKTQ
jgi:hypothetical protein